MKKYHVVLITLLIGLLAQANASAFEYSPFYQKLSADDITASFLKSCPAGGSATNTSWGISGFNFGKGFHFIHVADAEAEKQLLLAYGDSIANALRFNGFFIAAVNNSRYDTNTSPLRYTIFGNNKTNICDVVICSYRLPDDTVKIEAIFREYAMKE